MLQQDVASDYVLATGTTTSVRDFVSWAFEEVGVLLEWKGSGTDEKGYDRANGRCIVEVDRRYFRPTEVDLLIGDASKAREQLGWMPQVTVRELVSEMVREDLITMQATGRVTRDA
jgi:GDPmannose 4,6-dehydratase